MGFFLYTDFLYLEPDGDPRGPKRVSDVTIYICVRRQLTVCLLNIRNNGMTSKLDRACVPVKLRSYFVYFYYLYSVIYKYILNM